MLNMATLLEDSVRDHPDHIAVIFNEMKLPYQAINAAANQIANGLAGLGIGHSTVDVSFRYLAFFLEKQLPPGFTHSFISLQADLLRAGLGGLDVTTGQA